MKEATIASLSCSNSVIFVLLLFSTLPEALMKFKPHKVFVYVILQHSLKLYYSSTITTYSKVVVKMYYYNILLSCFQNIQGSTNCLRLSSGFYSLSPSSLYLWCCNWVQSGEEYLRNGIETPTPPSPLSNWEHLQKVRGSFWILQWMIFSI